MSDLINRSESFMNDLIRRKDVLTLFPINDCSDKMIGLYEKVLDIPTSYNPEKVVEELGEKKEIVKEYEKYHYSVRLNDAINIVKRGGIYE